jgi:hypothetical protein
MIFFVVSNRKVLLKSSISQKNQSIEQKSSNPQPLLAENISNTPDNTQTINVLGNNPSPSPSPSPFPDITYVNGVGFDVRISNPNPGSITDIQFESSNEPNTELIKSFAINVPAGWDFTKGDLFGNGTIVGKVSLNLILNDQPLMSEAELINDQNIQSHKAHWTVVLAGSKFDTFVDEDDKNGYKITMERNFIPNLKPPSKLSFTIFAQAANGSVIFTGPQMSGDNNLETSVKLFDNTTLQFQKTISLK